MKSVLISINPKWCELIASGKKTVEVRKTAPKEVPFKVYIYCTKARKQSDFMTKSEQFGYVNAPEYVFCNRNNRYDANGKVIGEFVCDKVEQYEANERGWYIYPQDEVCMWTDEIAGYGKGKPLYGWHISDLKIYDEPRELSEFVKPCNWNYDCCTCKRAVYELTKAEARLFYGCDRELTRPPQSWCYVEELC